MENKFERMKHGLKQLSATCIRTVKQLLSKFKFKTEPPYCRAYLKLNVFHLVAILHNLGGNAMSITAYKYFTCNQLCIDSEYLIAIRHSSTFSNSWQDITK